jgi:succinate-semialdehyde dehydrogenase/glutarate-semialdehyde dehydrogenase
VAGVSFTGHTNNGKILAALCGKYLKKITCELGGNDPFVVLEDANVDEAVKLAAQARLMNSGQICINAKRFIVH